MKAVIFCGGAGKRMWPLSREKTPKQLNKSIFDGGSTFEMTVERARLVTTPENIFVSTNRNFVDEIQAQAQEIDPSHIIAEPAIRDVAPAVGLMAAICAQTDPNEPMLILWCDHVVRRPDAFQQMMQKGEQIILNGQAGIVFIGQKPRYPEENLGYIGFGDLVETQGEIRQYDFIDWYYRPSKERAEEFFASGRYAWNTGYFITTPAFLLDKYAEMAPEMYAQLLEIADSYGTDL